MELAIAFPKAHPISPGFNTCDTFGSLKIYPKPPLTRVNLQLMDTRREN